MNYKIEGAIKKNRKNFIIFIILWIFIAIVLVSPIAYSFFKANGAGTTNGIQVFLETFVIIYKKIMKKAPIESLSKNDMIK